MSNKHISAKGLDIVNDIHINMLREIGAEVFPDSMLEIILTRGNHKQIPITIRIIVNNYPEDFSERRVIFYNKIKDQRLYDSVRFIGRGDNESKKHI